MRRCLLGKGWIDLARRGRVDEGTGWRWSGNWAGLRPRKEASTRWDQGPEGLFRLREPSPGRTDYAVWREKSLASSLELYHAPDERRAKPLKREEAGL